MLSAVILVAVAVIVGVLKALDFFGLLPKKKSAADAAAELQIAEHVTERLRAERDAAVARAELLEQTRSLEPILAQLSSVGKQIAENTKMNERVLERLAHHNGSFREIHESLRLVTDHLLRLQPVAVPVPIETERVA